MTHPLSTHLCLAFMHLSPLLLPVDQTPVFIEKRSRCDELEARSTSAGG